MSNSNHIIFVVYSGYVSFRDTNQRTGSHPIGNGTAETAIESLKQSLGIDDTWTSEILTASNVPAPSAYDKAVGIAMGNYLSEWEGTAVEAFTKLKQEEAEDFCDIEYATAWQPFEDHSIDDVVSFMDTLIDDIVRTFG
jgi:hypothetical protein